MAEGNQPYGGQAAGTTGAPDRRSRRRLLAGAAGVLGVAAAEVVGQAAPAQANNGNPVLQGTDNTFPTRRTAVFTPNNAEVGILADPNSSGKGSLGVYGIGGDAGVLGQGAIVGLEGGVGVLGIGAPGQYGVVGQSSVQGFGVHGIGGSDGGWGVAGEASGGDPAGADGVGVAGFASAASSNGIGVTGTGNGTGAGVVGTGGNNGGTGAGVQGTGGSNGGPGVHGTSRAASDPGVLAENTASGPALQVSGPAAFSRSGALTVAAGKSSATQTGVALTSASLVLAPCSRTFPGSTSAPRCRTPPAARSPST
jgi:hypothetical protein